MQKKQKPARRVKPLRAHDHIKKDVVIEPVRKPQAKKEKPAMVTEPKEQKTMAKAPAVEEGAGQVDPRIMQVVMALMPSATAEEQKKVGEAVQKLFDSAASKGSS